MPRTVVATYVYEDSAGSPVFRVQRTNTKEFYAQSRNGTGWVRGIKSGKHLPYRLPELIRGINKGQEPWIFEGEKDADTAAGCGLLSTCNYGGAKKWREEHSEWLSGCDTVNIVYDKDADGRAHAWVVADSLKSVGVRRIHFWRSAAGKDFTDHVDAGLGVDDLEYIPPKRPAEKAVESSALADHPDIELPVVWRMIKLLLSDSLKAELDKFEQFNAKCPAHPDRSPSLSLKLDPDTNKVLFKCQAGCTTEAIVAAMGLTMEDLNKEASVGKKSLTDIALERIDANEEAKAIRSMRNSNIFDFDINSEYLSDRFERNEPPPRFLIDGLMVEHSKLILSADPKAGKTRLVISLLKSMCDEEPFLGRQVIVPEDGTVLYVNFDMPSSQLTDWFREAGIRGTDKIILADAEGYNLPFWIEEFRHEMAAFCRDNKVFLILFDVLTHSSQHIVQSEGDNPSWARYFSELSAMRRLCDMPTWFGIHHLAKENKDAVRGGTTLEGSIDAVWFLEKEGDSHNSPRTFRARGRGVGLDPIELGYDDVTGLYKYEYVSAGEARRGRKFDAWIARLVAFESEHGHWPGVAQAKRMIPVKNGPAKVEFWDDARGRGLVKVVKKTNGETGELVRYVRPV